jgi:hypothetical protein
VTYPEPVTILLPSGLSAAISVSLAVISLSTTSGKAGGLTEVERLEAAWSFGR